MRIKEKETFYQWDINQVLINIEGTCIDYIIGDEIYRVDVVDEECRVPDEFLQESGEAVVYECYPNGTKKKRTFNIYPRPQPPEYSFTPTEKETFDTLVEKVNRKLAEVDVAIEHIDTALAEIEPKFEEIHQDILDLGNEIDNKADVDDIQRIDTHLNTLDSETIDIYQKLEDKPNNDDFKTINGESIIGEGNIKIKNEVKVKDVKISNLSIVKDGVANIPIANNTTNPYGLAKGGDYGVRFTASGVPYLVTSSDNQLKLGASQYLSITPSVQDKSVFYGLAKIAGADMKNSSNPIGTYTDEAKASIQKMIGIVTLTQEEYDLIEVKNESTIYVIVG